MRIYCHRAHDGNTFNWLSYLVEMRFLFCFWLRPVSCARLIESIRSYPIATVTATPAETTKGIEKQYHFHK